MELSKLKKNERFATATDSLPVSYETSTKKLHNRVPGPLKKRTFQDNEQMKNTMSRRRKIDDLKLKTGLAEVGNIGTLPATKANTKEQRKNE